MAARVAEAGATVILHLLPLPMAPPVDGTPLLPLTMVVMPGAVVVVVAAAAAGRLLEVFRALAACLLDAYADFIRPHTIEYGGFDLTMARVPDTRDTVEYAET
jgi:hypothetical protein